MKIIFSNGCVQVQRRDIDFLADANAASFTRLQNDLKKTDKHIKASSTAEDFVKVDDELLASYLKEDEQITSFWDYLSYSVDELVALSDTFEQTRALCSQKSNRNVEDSYFSYISYRYFSLLDMLYRKTSGKVLTGIPIEEDRNVYYQQISNRFAGVGTNVENLYLLYDLKKSLLPLSNDELKAEFYQMRGEIATGMSKVTESFVDPVSFHLVPTTDEKGHIFIKR